MEQLIKVATFTRYELDANLPFQNLTNPLNIHAIRTFKNHTIAIADYDNGLVLMEVLFDGPFIVSRFKVYSLLTSIQHLHNVYVEHKWDSDNILLTQLDPPNVFEVDISDPVNPVYLDKYSIPDNEGEYEGTKYITGNENYILSLVYSNRHAHLYIFIFQKHQDYMEKERQSVSLTRFDQEMNMLAFLDRYDNTFVHSTAYFMFLLNITDPVLNINGGSPEIRNFIGSEFFIKLTLESLEGPQIESQFRVIPVSEKNDTIFFINKEREEKFFYRLGDNQFNLDVGSYFSGPLMKLKVKSEEEEEHLPVITNQTSIFINQTIDGIYCVKSMLAAQKFHSIEHFSFVCL